MRVLLLSNFFLILLKNILCDEKSVASFSGSENCGGNFSGFQFPITSPNYPNDYPANQDCVYILKGSQFAKCDQEFHLQFLDFQLEASKGCGKDYVKVGTESIYCGNSIGIRKFKGQDNSLKLIFHSDSDSTAKGFRILVTTLPCVSTNLDKDQNNSVSTPEADLVVESKTETKESSENSYSLLPPEVEFDVEDERRGDQPPSRIQSGISPESPSENLQLPEFQRQHVHDKNCGHAYSATDDEIGSITSYLYLPPEPLIRPLKITSGRIAPSNSGANTPTELAIRNFEEQAAVTEPSTEFVVPLQQIPSPFSGQVMQQTRNTLRPLKQAQSASQFYDPNNNPWLTYGTPNSVPSENPSFPNNNNNNFDPFADSDIGNNNPGVNYNPAAPNCPGNNNNPNYSPDNVNNGNWNPNYNPPRVNFSPGVNVNPNIPSRNFGNGNGYGDTGSNFDTSFGVAGNNNRNNFGVDGYYYPNNNFYSPVDTGTTYYDTANTGSNQCCGTIYSSNNFLMSSPGFPALIYSSSNYDCRYTIQRSSSNICQLQMYLKFFNFGSDDQFCAYGYLEIDGNRFCGCKTGVNITSSFDNIATKIITVKYLGYPRNKFSGFVIEVTQVACSTGYLGFRNDQQYQNPIFRTSYLRNYKRSTSEDGEGEENGSSNSRGKRDLGYHYQRPNSAALTTSQNLQFLNTCRIFKFFNWVKAAKQVYLRNGQCSRIPGTSGTGISSAISIIPIFPDTSNSALINFPSSSNCVTVNLVEGTLSSPNYPNGYPNSLNQCYRFYKAPGYCQLELAMLDFNLENSTICRKDYVSFSGQKRRYCGTSLTGSRTIFDMTQSTFADLYFVTDSSGTGRGFRAGFTQISC